jgi:Fe-S cluster assembly protein SufD
MTSDNQMQDLHSSILHLAPETFSEQLERLVLGNNARSVFKGHIQMPQIAMRCEANQQCRCIMLGEKSRVQIMPTLDITADDVACSHGAAISDLDENAIFYLASRGISRMVRFDNLVEISVITCIFLRNQEKC